ncbi:MAG TPA: DUF192 domain-containing protein [Phycisphaerales bacterium]|nr:DUF192 domain-containing protein [Phycisphaerales bacterium]
MATWTRTLITAGLLTAAAALPLAGCDDHAKANATGGDKKTEVPKTQEVTIKGKTFKLDLVADDASRFKGLSGRTEIPPDGGMLFVFPRPITTSFVMRDCLVPIDIIYLDARGSVVNTYKMTVEDARGEGEKENDPKTGVNEKYEARLKKYPSEFDTQFVIELKGNTLDELKLEKGDKIKLEIDKLKKLAK